jgi:hypothetical protein
MLFMRPSAYSTAVENLCETPAAVPPIQSKGPERQGLFIVDPEHGQVSLVYPLSELLPDKTEAPEADSGHDA